MLTSLRPSTVSGYRGSEGRGGALAPAAALEEYARRVREDLARLAVTVHPAGAVGRRRRSASRVPRVSSWGARAEREEGEQTEEQARRRTGQRHRARTSTTGLTLGAYMGRGGAAQCSDGRGRG